MRNTDDSTTASDISSQESLLSAVKSELESPSTGSWFLILDNLTDETAITKFLPKSLNGMIIVTTRSLHLASGLGCQAVKVPRMSPANAVLLFKINYLNPDGSEIKQDEATELMELLKYLPARIVDAALDISKNRVSVRGHLAEPKTAIRLSKESNRPWRRFGLDWMYGFQDGAVVAAAWGCLVIFPVLFAWEIGLGGDYFDPRVVPYVADGELQLF